MDLTYSNSSNEIPLLINYEFSISSSIDVPQQSLNEHPIPSSESNVSSTFHDASTSSANMPQEEPSSFHDVSTSSANTPQEEPSNDLERTPVKLCRICHDVDATNHYRTLSCVACKHFFSRSIRENTFELYKCLKEQDCCVEGNLRNSCRYCRFHKCLEEGMKPEAVEQLKRAKINYPKKRSAPSEDALFSLTNLMEIDQNQLDSLSIDEIQARMIAMDSKIKNLRKRHERASKMMQETIERKRRCAEQQAENNRSPQI